MNPYESPSTAAAADDGQPPRPPRLWIVPISLLVMLPWPLVAWGLCLWGSLFESAFEAVILFGSFTLLLLLPLACGGLEIPEVILGIIIMIVWCAVLLFPVYGPSRLRNSKVALICLFILQGLYSAVQAGLGVLMLAGRSV